MVARAQQKLKSRNGVGDSGGQRNGDDRRVVPDTTSISRDRNSLPPIDAIAVTLLVSIAEIAATTATVLILPTTWILIIIAAAATCLCLSRAPATGDPVHLYPAELDVLLGCQASLGQSLREFKGAPLAIPAVDLLGFGSRRIMIKNPAQPANVQHDTRRKAT